MNATPKKLAEVFDMIENGGQSVLNLAEDILNDAQKRTAYTRSLKNHQFNLQTFKEAIERLCRPMAKYKELRFTVKAGIGHVNVFF